MGSQLEGIGYSPSWQQERGAAGYIVPSLRKGGGGEGEGEEERNMR